MTDAQPTQPLTDAELVAIRTRFDNRNGDMRSWGPVTLFHVAREVPRLLAEVDRLRAELSGVRTALINAHEAGMSLGQDAERLQSKLDALGPRLDVTAVINETIGELHDERNKLRARIDRLSAENSAHIGVNMACNAKIDRLQSQRDALVRKLGLDWGPDEFGDLDAD